MQTERWYKNKQYFLTIEQPEDALVIRMSNTEKGRRRAKSTGWFDRLLDRLRGKTFLDMITIS